MTEEQIMSESEFMSKADYLTYLKEREENHARMAERYKSLRTTLVGTLVDRNNPGWSMMNSQGEEVYATYSRPDHPVDMSKVWGRHSVLSVGNYLKKNGYQMSKKELEGFLTYIKECESTRVNAGKKNEQLVATGADEQSSVLLEVYLDMSSDAEKLRAPRFGIRNVKKKSKS